MVTLRDQIIDGKCLQNENSGDDLQLYCLHGIDTELHLPLAWEFGLIHKIWLFGSILMDISRNVDKICGQWI